MDDDEILLDGRKPLGEEKEVEHEHEHEHGQTQEQSLPDEKETLAQTSGGEEDHVAHVVAAIDAYLADPQHEDEQAAWSDDAVVQDATPAEDAAVQDTDPVDHAEEAHNDTLHAAPCAAYVEEEGESGGEEEDKEEDVDAVAGADEHDGEKKSQPGDRSHSRRSSSSSCASAASGRRASLRTEALIQAAARAVVATIEQQEGAHADPFSFLPGGLAGEPAAVQDDDDNHDMAENEKGAEQDGVKEEEEKEQDKAHGALEDEPDHLDTDDVFSDHGGSRSSLGSFAQRSAGSRSSRSCSSSSSSVHNSAAEEQGQQQPSLEGGDHAGVDDTSGVLAEDLEMDEGSQTGSVRRHAPRMSGMSGVSGFSRGTTPRISDVSGISSLSQYERRKRPDVDSSAYHDDDNSNAENDDGNSTDDGFAPYTARGTPRPAFRTPSDVRAIQMSSPSPSVIFGVSLRSAARRRRQQGSDGDGEERPTPTRFKVIRRPEPAPLVLLHATLMPTRWVWSDVLRSLDERMCADGPAGEDGTASHGGFPFPEPSAALRRLHTAWCQIQEYALGGDTVAERGLLLPHPQNDYEVLEERLLEALELPVRRRARILECGHYLGPAVADDDEEDEYDDEDNEYDEHNEHNAFGESDSKDQRHWCTTCRSDIRYESLGAERVFRVKVYASNGLVTVGAWEACWREMERVDVEIEPIVADAALLRELSQLRSLQQEALLWKQAKEAEEEAAAAAAADKTPLPHDVDYTTTSPTLEREPITAAEDLAHHVNFADVPPLPSTRAMSPPPAGLDASLEAEQVLEEERKRRDAEARLREIYGRTPPQTTCPIPPIADGASFVEDVPDDADTMETTRETPSAFGPSPPSPSAEAYARRQARRQRQGSGFSAVHEEAAPGQPAASRSWTEQQQQQQQQQPTPYEAASLPELLLAAVKVFLRDSQHVIAVLSALVILLAVTRSPTPAPLPLAGAVDTVVPPVKAVAHVAPVAAADAIVPVVSLDTLVEVQTETVVEKQTVRVVQTVTETATATTTVVAADERDEWSSATAPPMSEASRASEAFETSDMREMSGLSEAPKVAEALSLSPSTSTLEERALRPEPTSAVVSLFDAVALPMSAVDANAAAVAHHEL